jgi:putative transposase
MAIYQCCVPGEKMSLFKNVFRIESTRLKNYDYSQPGEYFITICIQNHECLFGEVHKEEMRLSSIGEITRKCWEEIPCHFNNIELDEYVIMPNHIHGIIIINDSQSEVQSKNVQRRDVQLNVSTSISPKMGSLSVAIRTYKAAVTMICRRNKLYEFCWQPRFYERIIRNEKELNDIRDYIINNSLKW